MLDRLRRLLPFQTPDTRRLAVLFGIVYFAQGTWYLPQQAVTITLKERGLSAGEVATFFAITGVPWMVKPIYGLISDFLPLFGRRRTSYFLLSTALAAACGFALAGMHSHPYGWLLGLFTAMALGLAFTDVLTDALMVESGKPLGLTGAFQAVQWGSIYAASIFVGELGGRFAEHRDLHSAFLFAAAFPLVSLLMVARFVKEPKVSGEREAFVETWRATRAAFADRTVWLVAGFLLLWTFSPSFGTALLYYETDTLGFSQQFIGHLAALASAAGILGATIYAPLSRRMSLRRVIILSIGIGVAGTLVYLGYRGPVSAVVINVVFGAAGMITQLAFLDLAAKACPRHVEATFFALLMSVFNAGGQGAQVVGGYLYDWLGLTPLIFISAAATALAWLLVPFVGIDAIEARAKAGEGVSAG
ncbi:MAG TPA: MFS transporter [Burkholderiales bacterium]|nr:MFS transporter [Burkholderiales bacterium]